MALDRQSIEKRDFPIGRRGYEPDAVDEHLAMLADEVDALRRSAGRSTRTESLASAASEQVRLIVEAAEQSAADIEREAELEARQIRQEAREAAEGSRARPGSRPASTSSASSEVDRLDARAHERLESEFHGDARVACAPSAGKLEQELQAAAGARWATCRGSAGRVELAPRPQPAPTTRGRGGARRRAARRLRRAAAPGRDPSTAAPRTPGARPRGARTAATRRAPG